MKILSQKDIDRFWGHVDKEKSNTFYNGTRCWEWTASSDRYGYIGIGRKVEKSHRVSWIIANGEIHDNLYVLHHCDNTLCCNPDHLFLGSQKDNVRDMENKGRGNKPRGERNWLHMHPETVRGEKNGNSKLTLENVSEIRRRYARFGKGGDTQEFLAKEFGVSQNAISSIVNYKKWK